MSHIVIFSAFVPPHIGGVENYIDTLTRELKRRHFRVTWVTHAPDSIPAIYLLNGHLPLPISWVSILKISRWLDRQKPDLIVLNCHFFPLTLFGAYLAKKKHLPVILIDHGSSWLPYASPILQIVDQTWERLCLASIHRSGIPTYGVSVAVNRFLNSQGYPTQGILPNCLNPHQVFPSRQSAQTNRSFTILFVGRFLKTKGPLELLTAYKIWLRFHPQSRLIMAGSGELLTQLRRHTESLKSVSIKTNLPHPEVLRLMAVGDVLVYPSTYPDGLPTILLEAGVVGCPVISTGAGGSAELITHRQTGYRLVDGRPPSILKGLEYVYQHPVEVKRWSEALYHRVITDYSVVKTVDSLERLIHAPA